MDTHSETAARLPVGPPVRTLARVVALVGTREASALLRVSPRRVLAMIEQGHFTTAQQIGREWVIERAEVLAIAGRARKGGRPKRNPS